MNGEEPRTFAINDLVRTSQLGHDIVKEEVCQNKSIDITNFRKSR